MDIRAVFLFSLIPGTIAVIVLIFFVKDVKMKKLSSVFSTTVIGNISRLLKKNKPFVILLIVTGIFSLGAFNFSFILLKASDLGIQQSVISLIYATINITRIYNWDSGWLVSI